MGLLCSNNNGSESESSLSTTAGMDVANKLSYQRDSLELS